jgi:hypothetical protein
MSTHQPSNLDTLRIELGPNFDDSYDPGEYREHAGPVSCAAGVPVLDFELPF